MWQKVLICICALCLLIAFADGADCSADVRRSCCVNGSYDVTLTTNTTHSCAQSDDVMGISLLSEMWNRSPGNQTCSKNFLFRASFQPLIGDNAVCPGCQANPTCGRRMLRIDIDIDPEQRKPHWVLDVGERAIQVDNMSLALSSRPNARLNVLNGTLLIMKGYTCRHHWHRRYGIRMKQAKWVTVFVSHEHVRIVTSSTREMWICSRCLFQLQGEPHDRRLESRPLKESVLYIGINRSIEVPIMDRYRGYGICRVRLSWVCPWCVESGREYQGDLTPENAFL